MGIAFISGLAISAAVVVPMTVVASLTLLPALLGFAGERVEVTPLARRDRHRLRRRSALVGVGPRTSTRSPARASRWPLLVIAARVRPRAAQAEVPKRPPKPIRETCAYRWSRLVQHHPWPAAIVGTFILVRARAPGARAAPRASPTRATSHEDTTTRQAYDLLADGFGPGYNGPFFLVGRGRRGAPTRRCSSRSPPQSPPTPASPSSPPPCRTP